MEPLTSQDYPNLHHHGSYLAAARWKNGPTGLTVLVSVHASPNPADPEAYDWEGDLPAPRYGGDPRYTSNQLWDSDLVLQTLRDLSDDGCVSLVAAGDFNEAMADDIEPGTQARLGTWGQEYYTRVKEAGSSDWLYDAWREERPTREALQLDRVLVSRPAEFLLAASREPHVGAAWARTSADQLSDHAPVWFALRTD